MSAHTMPDPPPLLGQSPNFLAALEHASSIAALERPVLIVGERGSGKELIAARIHFLSQRWDRDYVKINCAALAEDLLESELFGHEAGAFTGATAKHIGRFERADAGTLFLDEIATASLRAQEKILRVIEYGEFERVGGGKTLSTNVRVVAAANVDLPARADAGQFRADLLDRLAFDVITLPPLRERPEDILLLAEHFASRMASELGALRCPNFSSSALAQLYDHHWPGNVRELRNVAQRAVYRTLSEDPSGLTDIDTITLDPFASPWRPASALSPTHQDHKIATPPAAVATATASPPEHPHSHPDETNPPGATTPNISPRIDGAISFTEQINAAERTLVIHALNAARGRQTDAAKALHLTYHQLRGLMRKHTIRVENGIAKTQTTQPPTPDEKTPE